MEPSSQAEPILQRLPTGDNVVVCEGAVREKPSSKEEVLQFLKDYFGGHAATVGSVLVTNLKSGFRKGEWDQVEVETTNSVMRLPKSLTEKLIREALWLLQLF
ncbi:hypothetical protein RGQ29_009784 [Quercus rubra]|uniref:Uncharacterized protein n=1 Tax=Quercus rubra TaxID=3512 RepID=A0AAN7FZ77_QUERU|nr:hypothetical protein RGQ29_009784 [Quercus rubra]KAK4599871.1 hypothetical protein RGQ29_009784 [Quercus rubra]KAK4599872.1 hypothetical protein RGQ29_009784 [Quercus rubra]KAK4599873.1 hypothetical protein RGQ29_009784 [Quercus rubra]